MSKNMSNVVLVDANSFVYKSFYGYNPMVDMTTKDDYKVLTGLMQSLYDIVKNVDNIEFLFFVFDACDSALYRRCIYPAYKENRPPTPMELTQQRNFAKSVLQSQIGIPIIEYPGFEADDAIASLASYYKKNHNVIVVSPDKDLFQLVDERTMLLRPYKKDNQKVFEYISSKGVEKYFGVKAHQIPDYLALVGDTCDNLPGVDKIGKKTASYLLNKYSSIEEMFVIIEDIKQLDKEYLKVLTYLQENIDFIKMVKHLATVKSDLEISQDVQKSLEIARSIQETPAYFARVENLAVNYNWKPHFIEFLRA